MNTENQTLDQSPILGGGEFRFHDPSWLAWWLSSHYLLKPSEQIALAERLLDVVHQPDCADVLNGFIAHISDRGASGLSASVPDEVSKPELMTELPADVQSDLPQAEVVRWRNWAEVNWKEVALNIWKKHRLLLICVALVVGFQAASGLLFLANLVLGGMKW